MRAIILFFSLILYTGISAQDHRANLDEASAAIVKNLQQAQNQQLAIHTDKSHYKLGSTIWLRVYLYNAVSFLPVKSARIHVDLFDPRDSLVAALLLNSASNELDGAINSSSGWMPGPYIIKVYTEEMALSPSVSRPLETSVFLFRNGSDEVRTLALRHKPGFDVVPECEALINGVSNTVYFKAVSQNGEPLAVEGYLKDDQDKIVETFKTSVPGYGKFAFMPSKNRRYHAYLVMPDKKELVFALPAAAQDAWQLSLLRTTPSTLVFRVAQGDSLYAQKPVSYVAGLSHGRVVFASIGNGLYEINIPKDNFQQGPADILLFNERKELVSRRQVNIDRSSVQFNVIPDKTTFSSRELINLDLDLKDAKGQPMSGVFSISVTDERYVGLGHAYERNEFMDITDPVYVTPLKYAPVTDSVMWVPGKLVRQGGGAVSGVVTNLLSSDNFFVTDTTDAGGNFGFRVPEFYNGKTFGVQVTDQKGTVADAELQTFFQYRPWPSEPRIWVRDTFNRVGAYLKADADSFLTGQSMSMISGALAKPVGKKQAQADVRNRNSRMITGEQLDKLGLGTTSQAVMMLPGIVMRDGLITITGGTPSIGGGGGNLEPLVVTDGVPATNSNVAQYLNTLPPQNIESIEVMTGPEAAAYGTRGINGVIIVKTANQLRDNIPVNSKAVLKNIRPHGYHEAPPFYIPPYGEPAVRSLPFMDNRSTIFWAGEVLTDKNGKARVKFFAADQPSTYTIHVKGISSKGDLLYKTIRIGGK